jgi:hypothetical protein
MRGKKKCGLRMVEMRIAESGIAERKGILDCLSLLRSPVPHSAIRNPHFLHSAIRNPQFLNSLSFSFSLL